MQIIYEDEDIIALEKPPGIVVHQDDYHLDNSILDQVRRHVRHAELLHRLDKDTSGILLFAKNNQAYVYFKKLFHDHLIEKSYIALVYGHIKKRKGSIQLPIARSTSDPRKRTTLGAKGVLRNAITDFKVKKYIGDAYTLVEAFPKTGRTHQIRSHFASIGHAIVCDNLYSTKRQVCPAERSRQFLHAARLVFTNRRGVRLQIESELPEDLTKLLKELQ